MPECLTTWPNLDALAILRDKRAMDDVPTNPYALVKVLYVFAALFALCASAMWFRFVDARRAKADVGGAPSFRWLSEAATATGLTLFAAAGGFLLSLFL